MLDILIPKCGD